MSKEKLSLEEIKKLQLDILIKVADFCEKHNLRYFIAYGTLIGAIRHKGYIPWDDDIDIVMPRKDYNKFIELFNQENKNPNYLAIAPFKGNHPILKVADTRTYIKSEIFKNPHKKGVYRAIDVFPLDGVPEDETEFKEWYQKLYRLYYRYYKKQLGYTGGIYNRIRRFFSKLKQGAFLPKTFFKKTSERLHKPYPYESSPYVGAIEATANSPKNKVKKEWYDEHIMVEFEGYKFRAPKNYHEILSSIYGNYMELPPVEQRVFPHLDDVYWR